MYCLENETKQKPREKKVNPFDAVPIRMAAAAGRQQVVRAPRRHNDGPLSWKVRCAVRRARARAAHNKQRSYMRARPPERRKNSYDSTI